MPSISNNSIIGSFRLDSNSVLKTGKILFGADYFDNEDDIVRCARFGSLYVIDPEDEAANKFKSTIDSLRRQKPMPAVRIDALCKLSTVKDCKTSNHVLDFDCLRSYALESLAGLLDSPKDDERFCVGPRVTEALIEVLQNDAYVANWEFAIRGLSAMINNFADVVALHGDDTVSALTKIAVESIKYNDFGDPDIAYDDSVKLLDQMHNHPDLSKFVAANADALDLLKRDDEINEKLFAKYSAAAAAP
jgi:hypothetical protein